MTFSIRTPPRRALQAAWQIPMAIALGALAIGVVGVRAELVGFLYLAAVTPALCQADVTQRRLPNALVLPGYVVAGLGVLVGWLHTGQLPLAAVLACASTFVFLLLVAIGGGMGMGDVKLGGALGLNLGTLGVVAALAGPLFGFVLGGVAGLITLALPKTGAIRRLPFGPYLLAGFWVASTLLPTLDGML